MIASIFFSYMHFDYLNLILLPAVWDDVSAHLEKVVATLGSNVCGCSFRILSTSLSIRKYLGRLEHAEGNFKKRQKFGNALATADVRTLGANNLTSYHCS